MITIAPSVYDLLLNQSMEDVQMIGRFVQQQDVRFRNQCGRATASPSEQVQLFSAVEIQLLRDFLDTLRQ